MRISTTLGAEPLGAFRPPADVAADAVAAEEAGFAAAWMTHMSRGVDALSVLAVAASRTSRIELGVGVVPTYPRHPHVLAQQAATVQALAGGRLTLGIGVSHRPVVEGLVGLAYASPAEHLREYLSVLVPLVRTGSVTYRGERYTVDGGFTVPGTSPVDVLVGGMGARTVEVAGRHADGLVTWLAGPGILDAEIGPRLRSAAADAGRPAPRLVAAAAVAVCRDVTAARATAGVLFARYQGLANYQRVLARQGDARVADLALVGDEAAVERGVRAFADAGVTELWAVPFPIEGAGDDGGLVRTRAVLVDLAGAASRVGGA